MYCLPIWFITMHVILSCHCSLDGSSGCNVFLYYTTNSSATTHFGTYVPLQYTTNSANFKANYFGINVKVGQERCSNSQMLFLGSVRIALFLLVNLVPAE